VKDALSLRRVTAADGSERVEARRRSTQRWRRRTPFCVFSRARFSRARSFRAQIVPIPETQSFDKARSALAL
jgi:hypothetical protein